MAEGLSIMYAIHQCVLPRTEMIKALPQDLGNSNYCVFMPRTQFERRTNALLVSDALNNLDINTYVNDRNDICIAGFKMSLFSYV